MTELGKISSHSQPERRTRSNKEYNLYLVLDQGDGEPHWTYWGNSYPPEVIITRDPSTASLENLVLLCDRDAESCNAHEFCGMHRLLGAVLYRQQGREDATKIMLKIAQLGGLHRMGGFGREGDAYEELGVGEAGRDWEGSFGT